MISNAQIAAMVASLIVSVAFPAALVLVWRKRTHAPLSAVAVGAAMFFLFAMVLEQIPHYLLLQPSGYIMNHTWAYILYGPLAAGLFEETGRFVGFKLLLRRHTEKPVSVMYGIGHGGIESILLCSVNMVVCLVAAMQLNAAGGNVDALSATLQATAQGLAASPTGILALAGYERMVTICFHIGLSVLVFEAANRPGKLWMYPLAIAAHALVDVAAVLHQRGLISMVGSEALMSVAVVVFCLLIAKLYRSDAKKTEEAVEISAENE